MRPTWCLALAAALACGRIGFRDHATIDAGTADARDASDGRVDAAAEIKIDVDPGPHHLGDNVAGIPPMPEGTVITDVFAMAETCGSATLELDFVGPFGPNMNDEPTLTLDGSDLGHVFAFFPPFSDPAWAAGMGDYNGPNNDEVFDIHVALACAPLLGSNTFVFRDNNSTDDMFFDDIIVRCDHPTP